MLTKYFQRAKPILEKLEAEGYEARAILHEIDHLNGVLFESKIIRIVDPSEFEEMDEEESEDESGEGGRND